ncbi:hypothetical protein [Eilatimonas milleporae]|uniref:Tetratricopeptide repeat protein n=1 Tax=Eilatimonas milleporae TaxID=911205 RepID=A0A3M0CS58_9PROT|nr:hypothetical protein [Eilatimonas milleporae]RMB12362.1 hypothetical protein BXY39_0858 [Eilatimonas milleporae]
MTESAFRDFLAGPWQAIRTWKTQYDLKAIITLYAELCDYSVRTRKDIPAFVLISSLAAQDCLDEARAAEAGSCTDPDLVSGSDSGPDSGPDSGFGLARLLRERAKVLLYNLGANTWPGWGDGDVTIDGTARLTGFWASQKSLDLVRSLELGAYQLGNGLWLTGAHALAAGMTQAAEADFRQAKRHFLECDTPVMADLATGYGMLAGSFAGHDTAAEFDGFLADLRGRGDKGAASVADQIETARGALRVDPDPDALS